MEDKTIFLETLGDYPAIRIIDFLIGSDMFDYTKTEIARNSNVHFATFQKIWKSFEKRNFVIKTRVRGKKQFYKANKENPVIKKLFELDDFLTNQATEEAYKKHQEYKQKKALVKAKN